MTVLSLFTMLTCTFILVSYSTVSRVANYLTSWLHCASVPAVAFYVGLTKFCVIALSTLELCLRLKDTSTNCTNDAETDHILLSSCSFSLTTRGQSNLTKSASRGAHSPVRGHPRGSKVVPLNFWGRVSY